MVLCRKASSWELIQKKKNEQTCLGRFFGAKVECGVQKVEKIWHKPLALLITFSYRQPYRNRRTFCSMWITKIYKFHLFFRDDLSTKPNQRRRSPPHCTTETKETLASNPFFFFQFFLPTTTTTTIGCILKQIRWRPVRASWMDQFRMFIVNDSHATDMISSGRPVWIIYVILDRFFCDKAQVVCVKRNFSSASWVHTQTIKNQPH